MARVQLSKGCSIYGADMGRRSYAPEDVDVTAPRKFTLQALHLDTGGYDSGGAYWGSRENGERLYQYASTDGEIEGYLDARGRADARAKVAARFPGARFYR